MTENLYLILHKVRGEPAFDIASQVEVTEGDGAPGPVWIIPTSGHRAYPWYWVALNELNIGTTPILNMDSFRDHYAASEPRSVPPVRRVQPAATEDFIV